jgi:hypothetical protein
MGYRAGDLTSEAVISATGNPPHFFFGGGGGGGDGFAMFCGGAPSHPS